MLSTGKIVTSPNFWEHVDKNWNYWGVFIPIDNETHLVKSSTHISCVTRQLSNPPYTWINQSKQLLPFYNYISYYCSSNLIDRVEISPQWGKNLLRYWCQTSYLFSCGWKIIIIFYRVIIFRYKSKHTRVLTQKNVCLSIS